MLRISAGTQCRDECSEYRINLILVSELIIEAAHAGANTLDGKLRLLRNMVGTLGSTGKLVRGL